MNGIALIILVAFFLIFLPIILVLWIVVRFARHIYFIQISTENEGALLSQGGRYRMKKGLFYPIWDFTGKNYLYHDYATQTITKKAFSFGSVTIGKDREITKRIKKPLYYADIKDFLIVTESLPIVGPKLTLKLKRIGSALFPWSPLVKADENLYVSNTRVVKIGQLREEWYNSTKTALTNQEMLMRIAVPMGLILLATIIIIFLPKIIETVNGQSSSIYDSSRNAIFDWLGQNPPKG